VPQRRRRKRLGASTTPNPPTADAPNVLWAVDFQFDATTDGRPIKVVSIVDEHTRECLGGLVERNIIGRHLIDELDRLAGDRGYPAVLRCDNGPELACAAIADWAGERVGLHFVPPGQPLAQRRHRVVQQPGARRMPQHQHVLVTGSGAGGDQRLEGGLQPPPATLRARPPGPSGLRCSPHPSMIDSADCAPMSRCILRAPGGPVDLDRYALREGSRVGQV
jgi:Integrase core domain